MNSIEMHMVAFADKITIKRQSSNHTQESCFYESVINAQIASFWKVAWYTNLGKYTLDLGIKYENGDNCSL